MSEESRKKLKSLISIPNMVLIKKTVILLNMLEASEEGGFITDTWLEKAENNELYSIDGDSEVEYIHKYLSEVLVSLYSMKSRIFFEHDSSRLQSLYLDQINENIKALDFQKEQLSKQTREVVELSNFFYNMLRTNGFDHERSEELEELLIMRNNYLVGSPDFDLSDFLVLAKDFTNFSKSHRKISLLVLYQEEEQATLDRIEELEIVEILDSESSTQNGKS